jgi:hypothetical protein
MGADNDTVVCLGCGREAEMEYEPEPSAERSVPILPTGWEVEPSDEYYCDHYYCPDCVVRHLRNQLKERELRLEEAVKISHEMRSERDRLQGQHGVFVESTNKTIATLKQENESLQQLLNTARFDLSTAQEAWETANRRWRKAREEVEKLTEMRRVGHGRLEALVRKAFVLEIDTAWMEEAEQVLCLSKTMARPEGAATVVAGSMLICEQCPKLARAKELEESAKAVTRSVQNDNEQLRKRLARLEGGEG